MCLLFGCGFGIGCCCSMGIGYGLFGCEFGIESCCSMGIGYGQVVWLALAGTRALGSVVRLVAA
jgi:hypothetical protein